MAIAINSADTCVLDAPASRRFYVHVGSLGFLVAAQPSIFEEVAYALGLSGASRALDQAAEDWEMFPSSGARVSLAQNAANLHKLAADALRTSFQCIVYLVPAAVRRHRAAAPVARADQRVVLRGRVPHLRHR